MTTPGSQGHTEDPRIELIGQAIFEDSARWREKDFWSDGEIEWRERRVADLIDALTAVDPRVAQLAAIRELAKYMQESALPGILKPWGDRLAALVGSEQQ